MALDKQLAEQAEVIQDLKAQQMSHSLRARVRRSLDQEAVGSPPQGPALSTAAHVRQQGRRAPHNSDESAKVRSQRPLVCASTYTHLCHSLWNELLTLQREACKSTEACQARLRFAKSLEGIFCKTGCRPALAPFCFKGWCF